MNTDTVKLAFGSRSADIPLGDLEEVELGTSRRWARLRLRYAAGMAVVSGLPPTDAEGLAAALDTSRIDWWRRSLAPQIGPLRAVHDRIAMFADPPKYIDAHALRDLARDAQRAAGGLVARWPDSLSNAPEIQMLRGILEFLEAPDDARSKANLLIHDSHPAMSARYGMGWVCAAL